VELLESYELYETLMWPTYRMLEALGGCRAVGDVLHLSVAQEPPPPGDRARSPEWGQAGPVAERGVGGG